MNKPTHHTQIKLYVLPRPGQERTYTLANVSPEEHHHIGLALQAAKLEAEVLASRDDATLIQLLNLIDQTHRQHGFEVSEEDIDLDEFRADYQAKIPVLGRVIQTWEDMGNACASVLEGISPAEWEAVRYALLSSHKEALIYSGMTQGEVRQRVEAGKIIVEGWGLEAFDGYDVYSGDWLDFFIKRVAVLASILKAADWEIASNGQRVNHICSPCRNDC